MTLTTDDIAAITDALHPQFSGVKQHVDTSITDLRREVRQLFQEHSAQLAKAIADAVKLVADMHATKEEVQELRAEVEDLKDRLQKLERLQKTA
jgi:ubiquinone biosynthesis protein UbiJ